MGLGLNTGFAEGHMSAIVKLSLKAYNNKHKAHKKYMLFLYPSLFVMFNQEKHISSFIFKEL